MRSARVSKATPALHCIAGTKGGVGLHMVYALHRQVVSTKMGKSLRTLALCQRRSVGSNAWRVDPFNVVWSTRSAWRSAWVSKATPAVHCVPGTKSGIGQWSVGRLPCGHRGVEGRGVGHRTSPWGTQVYGIHTEWGPAGPNAWCVNSFNAVDPARHALSLGLQGYTCCPLNIRDKGRGGPRPVSRMPCEHGWGRVSGR
jgi:hypothetical protein